MVKQLVSLSQWKWEKPTAMATQQIKSFFFFFNITLKKRKQIEVAKAWKIEI